MQKMFDSEKQFIFNSIYNSFIYNKKYLTIIVHNPIKGLFVYLFFCFQGKNSCLKKVPEFQSSATVLQQPALKPQHR